MGKHYEDPLLFLLDGVVDGCEDLKPSPELQRLWDAWDKKVLMSLRLWAAGHGVSDGMEQALGSEIYAYDVYQTLVGAGVGVDDGDWDVYFSHDRKTSERLIENLEKHLKKWLQKDCNNLEMRIQDEAFGQCEDEAESLDAVTVKPVLRRPKWTIPPRG